MGTKIWVNIGSGNGLLPDSTRSLPEPMLTDHQWLPMTFILGQFHNISQQMPQPSITKICLKITCVRFHWNFPGTNELTIWWLLMPWVLASPGQKQPHGHWLYRINGSLFSLTNDFHIPASPQCSEMIEKSKISFMLPKLKPADGQAEFGTWPPIGRVITNSWRWTYPEITSTHWGRATHVSLI